MATEAQTESVQVDEIVPPETSTKLQNKRRKRAARQTEEQVPLPNIPFTFKELEADLHHPYLADAEEDTSRPYTFRPTPTYAFRPPPQTSLEGEDEITRVDFLTPFAGCLLGSMIGGFIGLQLALF